MNIDKDFKGYIDRIKALGYRVFVKEYTINRIFPIRFCHISDGIRVGYCQLGDYGYGARFGTEHKPNRGIGGGFGITDWDKPVFEIERRHIEECLAFAPDWVTNEDLAKVEKYTLDEFIKAKGVVEI